MGDNREIFADRMLGFIINKEGTIAKLVVASDHPDSSGKPIQTNRTVLTMPVSAMQQVLETIQGAIGQSGKGKTKN